jgi:hypothetical protein
MGCAQGLKRPSSLKNNLKTALAAESGVHHHRLCGRLSTIVGAGLANAHRLRQGLKISR